MSTTSEFNWLGITDEQIDADAADLIREIKEGMADPEKMSKLPPLDWKLMGEFLTDVLVPMVSDLQKELGAMKRETDRQGKEIKILRNRINNEGNPLIGE